MLPIDVFIPSGIGEKLSHYKPLLELTGVKNKGHIKLNNKFMLDYIIEEVDAAKNTKSITIGGLNELLYRVSTEKPLQFIEGGNTAFESYLKAAQHFKSLNTPYFMTISGDIPLITAEMIDAALDVVDFGLDLEAYYNVVWHTDKQRVYPKTRKIPIKLKEGWILSGDLNVFKPDSFLNRQQTVESLMSKRKSVFSIIKILSFRYILKYILGRLSLEDIFRRFKQLYDLDAAFLVTEFPEPCIDLDFAEDLPYFQDYIKTKPRSISGEKAYLMTKENYNKFI